MNRPRRPDAIHPSPNKNLELLGRKSSNSGKPAKYSQKVLLSYGLQAEYVKWLGIAADRNQWRAVCGFKMLSATKETPAFSR
jgi:hypothetical protein